MSGPNSPQPQSRSWPYVVTTVVVVAAQQGWEAQHVIMLTVSLLVLIALVSSAADR